MLKILVCVSGGGTNLQAIIDGIQIRERMLFSVQKMQELKEYVSHQRTTKTELLSTRLFWKRWKKQRRI